MSNFKIISKDGLARAGVLKTAHGEIKTPVFMPVGTQGTVKALDPIDLRNAGAQIILGNTYHLYLRPGHKLIKKIGGLHQFMDWNLPILTDSGGFQAFSLGAMIEHGVRKTSSSISRLSPHEKSLVLPEDSLGVCLAPETNQFPTSSVRSTAPHFSIAGDFAPLQTILSKIREEGIEFISHLDGSKHLLTPELSMEVQLDLGSDICLVLDELLSPLHDPEYVKLSLERTHRWELQSKDYFNSHVKNSINPGAQIFGILQGVYNREIREKEARWVSKQDFNGISIGGSFGTSEYWYGDQNVGAGFMPARLNWAAAKAIYETVGWVSPLLPSEWPKHILGIGEVEDIFNCVEKGADMFDCVSATRRARNGSLYIHPEEGGKINNHFALLIANSEFKEDSKPIDEFCHCYTCGHFSRAYLRHLYLAKELLYYRLASIHNIYFLTKLMEQIREAILNKHFLSLKKHWLGL